MILDEIRLFIGFHFHAWIIPSMVWFILNRNSFYVDAIGFHRLDVLHKIMCVSSVISWHQKSTLAVLIAFHPNRRTPRASHDFYIGIDRNDFF